MNAYDMITKAGHARLELYDVADDIMRETYCHLALHSDQSGVNVAVLWKKFRQQVMELGLTFDAIMATSAFKLSRENGQSVQDCAAYISDMATRRDETGNDKSPKVPIVHSSLNKADPVVDDFDR